jgi:hypothetical protein
MHSSEEFMWGGLRTRLERTGRVRPRTIRLGAFGQRPELVHAQVRFRPATPALRARFETLQTARGR